MAKTIIVQKFHSKYSSRMYTVLVIIHVTIRHQSSLYFRRRMRIRIKRRCCNNYTFKRIDLKANNNSFEIFVLFLLLQHSLFTGSVYDFLVIHDYSLSQIKPFDFLKHSNQSNGFQIYKRRYSKCSECVFRSQVLTCCSENNKTNGI